MLYFHNEYVVESAYTYKNANKTCQSIDKFTWLCYNKVDNKTCQQFNGGIYYEQRRNSAKKQK